jgi:hypothetical protein
VSVRTKILKQLAKRFNLFASSQHLSRSALQPKELTG